MLRSYMGSRRSDGAWAQVDKERAKISPATGGMWGRAVSGTPGAACSAARAYEQYLGNPASCVKYGRGNRAALGVWRSRNRRAGRSRLSLRSYQIARKLESAGRRFPNHDICKASLSATARNMCSSGDTMEPLASKCELCAAWATGRRASRSRQAMCL